VASIALACSERIAEKTGFHTGKMGRADIDMPIILCRFHRKKGKLVALDANDEESCFQFILI